MTDHELISMLVSAGVAVRDKVSHSLRTSGTEALSAVHEEKKEDTIYRIDRDVEDVLVPVIAEMAGAAGGIVLIAEGIGDEGEITLPPGIKPADARYRLIVDPIDGTRNIMYDKRSAFFLAGLAPNRGDETSLKDITIAVMAELPTTRQYVADVLWAVRGKGAHCETHNLQDGTVSQKSVRPSKAKTIIGGFAQFARFFPPGRDILSGMEDELISTIFPDNRTGKAIVFEDQYISSGGQLYEMLMGHDRFVADVRGLLYRMLAGQGKPGGHVCHPYDVCAHLIGSEAGVIITDGFHQPLNAPLSLDAEINWVGYANDAIFAEVQPILARLLKKYGLHR